MRRKGDEEVAWVALRAAATLGDAVGARLIARFGSVLGALRASASQLRDAGFGAPVSAALAKVDLDAARFEVDRMRAAGARLITRHDAEYPVPLQELTDAPLYLVARGEPLTGGPSVAIVGARQATPYGRAIATRFAEELAQAGVTVVSGLARGIDAAAHEGALRGGGCTIAVLGSGIDVIYPAEHAGLAERIVTSGTLLSERPVGAPPLAGHFPARNRVIAGMTQGTVVVEAAERSGSLITARIAIDQGREVFAVPGRIDSPLSAGAHRLIQQGAKLTATVDDILNEIVPALRARAGATPPPTRAVPGEDPQGEPLIALLTGGPLALDELIRSSGLTPSQVLARVLDLELRGLVIQLPGQQVQLSAR